jgi:hypothetical protein
MQYAVFGGNVQHIFSGLKRLLVRLLTRTTGTWIGSPPARQRPKAGH